MYASSTTFGRKMVSQYTLTFAEFIKNKIETRHETVPPTQAELIQELKIIVTQIDNDKVFVDDALRSQLEPVQHQLETLSDLAKPRTSRPKNL